MNAGLEFRSWLITEEVKTRPHVFFDMDETLVAIMEVGWMKEDPANSNFDPLTRPGESPFPDVVLVKFEDRKLHVFPRPGLREFLEQVNKFADIHILSHAKPEKIKNIIKALKLTDLLPMSELHSTRKLSPNALQKKYNLGDDWIMVDNLWPTTAEMVNKMRILGLNFPNKSPKEEGELISNIGKGKFVNVKEYRAEVAENYDYELYRALGEIKKKLGLPL